MMLSELQEEILNAPDRKIVVISSAASGKTRLMTEKVRQLLRKGENPQDIAVITFTNMAAAELRQRLGGDYKAGLFVGTIHALANFMLCSNGIDTSSILDKEDFDALFEMIESHPQSVKHLKWILLDEGQDSDDLQFSFLFDMIEPDCFFICADPKQSIYQWKGSNPALIQRLAKEDDVTEYNLNQNYRNRYNILNYAKKLIEPTGQNDPSVAMRNGNGTVAELPFESSLIINKIKETNIYGDWAILTRTNQEIAIIINILDRAGIPYDTFKQGELTKEALTEKMESNTVKVLTVHSAKGLEWNNVMVLGMRYKPKEERNVCYVAATRARNNLIWLHYKPKKGKYINMRNWE